MNRLRVAVAQTLARPGELEQSIEDHVRLATQAANAGARLVLFPELSLTGYHRQLTRADALSETDPRLAPLQAVAEAHDIRLIVGAPLASDTGLRIGALSFAKAQPVSVYTKRHLHPGEELAFEPGIGGEPQVVNGQAVCLAICAEISHAEHAAEAAQRGARIYAASCFITPGGYAADRALLQGYARAHRMAVLMANFGCASGGWESGGRSAIWSSDGECMACGPEQGEALVVAELTLPSRSNAAVG